MTGVPEFLVRYRPDRQIVSAPRLRVSYRRKYRREPMGDSGFARAVEVGVDKSNLDVRAVRDGDEKIVTASGQRMNATNWTEGIGRTAADVKAVVRRIRPEEREKLAEVDARIAALQQQIADLREQRIALVRDAWTRAHVVRLSEVEALVE